MDSPKWYTSKLDQSSNGQIYVDDEFLRVFVTSKLSPKKLNSLEEIVMGLIFHFYTFFSLIPQAGIEPSEIKFVWLTSSTCWKYLTELTIFFTYRVIFGPTHANCTENPFLNCVIFYLFNIEIITAIMPINRIYKLQRKKILNK